MSLMLGKLYSALKAAGISEGAAEAAAEEVAKHTTELQEVKSELQEVKSELKLEMQDLRSELKLHRWMLGFNLALSMAILFLLYQVFSRLH